MSNINFIEILTNSLNDPVNLIFFILIIGLFFTDLIKKKDLKAQIVSVGVLGTFVGIFLGLQSFNPEDMKNSINHILDGLKTAFFTSIVGMLAASSLAIYQRVTDKDIDDEKSEEKILNEISNKLNNNAEIVTELRSLNLRQDKFGKEISSKLNNNAEIVTELRSLNLRQDKFGNEISLKLDKNVEIVDELKKLNIAQEISVEEIKQVAQSIYELKENSNKENQELTNILNINFENINRSLTIATEHIYKFGNEVSLKLNKNIEISEELKRLNLAQEKSGKEIKKVAQSIYKLKENSSQENRELIHILNTNFDRMNYSLEIAIEQLSKGATEEIINALKQVIEEFNQELQTQFGENFIKLNESVINLLQWQENYKTHVEVLESKLTLSTNSIEKSKNSLNIIASKNNEIIKVYTNLEGIINTYKEQVNDLNKHLQTYSELSQGARNMFSSIQNNMSSTQSEFSNLSKSIKNTNKDIYNSYKANKNQLDMIGKHFRAMGVEIPKALQVSLHELDRGLATLTTKFKKDFDKILQEHRRNM